MKLNIHLLLCSKRHYIDEIEYPPSPICGEKPQFESNVTSFQFRQNASARWWPIGHHLASAFWRGKKIWNVSQELFIQYKPYIEEQRMIDIGWLFSTYLFKYVKQYALHTIIGIAWSAKNIFPQFSSRRPHLILNIWCGLRCYKNNS